MNNIRDRFEFRPAYLENGKCSWERKQYMRAKGVYIIIQGDEIRYVGKSGSRLYDMAYRHFQNWIKRNRNGRYNDKYFSRDLNYELTLIPTDDPDMLEVELIWELKPTDNANYYGKLNPHQETPEIMAFEGDYKLLEWFENQEEL